MRSNQPCNAPFFIFEFSHPLRLDYFLSYHALQLIVIWFLWLGLFNLLVSTKASEKRKFAIIQTTIASFHFDKKEVDSCYLSWPNTSKKQGHSRVNNKKRTWSVLVQSKRSKKLARSYKRFTRKSSCSYRSKKQAVHHCCWTSISDVWIIQQMWESSPLSVISGHRNVRNTLRHSLVERVKSERQTKPILLVACSSTSTSIWAGRVVRSM